MAAETYQFPCGEFTCLLVSDGTFTYHHADKLLFVNAPRDELAPLLHQHGLQKDYVSPYPCLLVQTNEHCVLIDTGAGKLAPTTGKLIGNLKSHGISPHDVDTVILTHAHPDHIGGNVDTNGRSAFPNARIEMWKQEWEFWMSEPDISALQINPQLRQILLECPQKCLLPIQDQVTLVEGESEIVPGIRALTAPGHTPGHIVVSITSGEQQLLYLSDTVVHPIHLAHPGWCVATDFCFEQAIATRHRILDLAANANTLSSVFHFPFPGLGHIRKDGHVWRWEHATGT